MIIFFIYSFVLNKKLVFFINDMCMKMFFSLVNNAEKSTVFSGNSKYLYLREMNLFIMFYCILLDTQSAVMNQYQCLSISSKCCFLLTAVRGMHSDPSIPNKHLLKEYDD